MVSIAGQNAVITGASRGIGRAAALALAKEGVNIAVTARNEAELASLVLEATTTYGVKAQAFPADAADASAVAKLRDAVHGLRVGDVIPTRADHEARVARLVERRVMRCHVRIVEDDVAVDGPADGHRPPRDGNRLACVPLAIEDLHDRELQWLADCAAVHPNPST